MSKKPSNLKIAIFADGAKEPEILKRHQEGIVSGFTTNPSLVAKAGVTDFAAFAKSLLAKIKDMPISFEVFSDEFDEMERQAKIIRSWGPNVHVKIPITNTRRESALPLIRRLLDQGIALNVTALFTREQIRGLHEVVKPSDPEVLVSIFAGRIADTGVDPIPLMKESVALYKDRPSCKILWASTREPLNIYQADQCGCHIITVPDDLISKLSLHGTSLEDYSLETVKGFYKDAQKAGFSL